MRATSASATPVITAGAYSANDAVGGLLTFENMAHSGKIFGVTITDKTTQAAELILVLFNASFTATTDNNAFDPSDADLLNIIGKVKVETTDYTAFADNCAAYKEVNGPHYLLPTGTTKIYGQLMATGTPTYASTSDLKVTIHVGANTASDN